MNTIRRNHSYNLFKELVMDCNNCSGLCCIALYCLKSEGFPDDKKAGEPCRNLMPNFQCKVHDKLKELNFKGCISYDCLGAGQKVTNSIYKGINWKTPSEYTEKIFDVFLIVCELHQMQWYLTESSLIYCADEYRHEIDLLIDENKKITNLSPEELLTQDISEYKKKVNSILKKVGESVQLAVRGKAEKVHLTYLLGKDLRNRNLRGQNFNMSLLIAANMKGCDLYGTNFLGADMRDTNIKNADLSQSIFLTQMQVNSAKGNHLTKLPAFLTHPEIWDKD